MNQGKIGRFIAKCRKEKNITQEELAEKLGVTNRSVSRWETGKNMPDYSILKELCNILDIDVNEFLTGEKIKKDEIENRKIDNLDLILKEYYKMKKQRNRFKVVAIVFLVIIFHLAIIIGTIVMLNNGYKNRLHITTNKMDYNDVIGSKSKGIYKDKWGIKEEIFPKTISNLNAKEFKMICDDFLDQQFLSYLVVDYNEEDYKKEIERLTNYGIKKYKGYYNVTGFTNYELVAMESDEYYGFIYAITDGKSKIIYVELIFCNYTMDIDYENEIPKEYLPDGFNAKEDNPYRVKIMESGK